jgi:hypothetical protein
MKSNRCWCRQIRNTALFFVFSFAQFSGAQEFEASGFFKSEFFWQQYKAGEEAVTVVDGDFSVIVQDCRSEVQYKVTSTVCHLKQFETVEAGAILSFDGTNYYELGLVKPNLTNSAKIVPTGKIWSGPVPERAGDKLGTLWLAFASHCYFKTADKDLIYSPFMSSPTGRDVWTKDHRVRARWSILSNNPGLPASVVHSSEFVFNSTRSAHEISDVVFSVSAITNFEGMTLPKNFERKFYTPAGSLVNSFSGELTAVKSPILPQSFIPPLTASRTYIIDERFIGRAGNPVPEYMDKSSSWPTLEEGERNLNKPVGFANNSSMTIQHGAARVVTLVVLVLLALVPITLLLVKQIKNGRTKE